MIKLDDKDNWVFNIPKFMQSWFIKKYYQQGFVYLKNNKPTYMSDRVKWLENVYVETTTTKRADEIFFKYFNNKYPEYEGYVQLF